MTDTSGALAIRRDQDIFDDKQKAALATMGMRNVDPATLAVFMHVCRRTGLDPFLRQICLIKRREKIDGAWVDKWTVQVQIDGFRVVRDRVAARLGVTVDYEDSIWYDRDGNERKVWLDDGPPAACSLTVLKNGHRFPAVVRYKALVQTKADGDPNAMWTRMDAEQLEKCAEAKALRRAFPNDLGDVYVADELPPDTGAPANGNGHQVAPRTVQGAVEAQAHTRAPQPAPAPAAEWDDPLPGEPAPEPGPNEPITNHNRNDLAGALASVHISKPADRYRLLSAYTTRHITRADQLTNGEATAIITLIQQELETAGGDIDQAQAKLWDLANDNLNDPRDDGTEGDSHTTEGESSVNDTRPNHDGTGAGPTP